MNPSFGDQFGKFVGGLMFVLATTAVIACFLGYPTMLLWNYTMPEVFGLQPIDFWHALTLNLLCGILFGKHYSSRSKRKKKATKTSEQ